MKKITQLLHTLDLRSIVAIAFYVILFVFCLLNTKITKDAKNNPVAIVSSKEGDMIDGEQEYIICTETDVHVYGIKFAEADNFYVDKETFDALNLSDVVTKDYLSNKQTQVGYRHRTMSTDENSDDGLRICVALASTILFLHAAIVRILKTQKTSPQE